MASTCANSSAVSWYSRATIAFRLGEDRRRGGLRASDSAARDEIVCPPPHLVFARNGQPFDDGRGDVRADAQADEEVHDEAVEQRAEQVLRRDAAGGSFRQKSVWVDTVRGGSIAAISVTRFVALATSR